MNLKLRSYKFRKVLDGLKSRLKLSEIRKKGAWGFDIRGIYEEIIPKQNHTEIFKGIHKYLPDILGVRFKKALFVPNASVYYKVGSHSLPPTEVDLSWQFTLQKIWEYLMQSNKGMKSIMLS